MNKQQGAVLPILIVLLLLGGLVAGVYLSTSGNPLKLFSKASNEKVKIAFDKSDVQKVVGEKLEVGLEIKSGKATVIGAEIEYEWDSGLIREEMSNPLVIDNDKSLTGYKCGVNCYRRLYLNKNKSKVFPGLIKPFTLQFTAGQKGTGTIRIKKAAIVTKTGVVGPADIDSSAVVTYTIGEGSPAGQTACNRCSVLNAYQRTKFNSTDASCAQVLPASNPIERACDCNCPAAGLNTTWDSACVARCTPAANAPVCTITASESSVPTGRHVSLTSRGSANAVGAKKVSMFISKADGTALDTPIGERVFNRDRYYYKIATCDSVDSIVCAVSKDVATSQTGDSTHLPAGDYVAFCNADTRDAATQCSGNPFCNFNGATSSTPGGTIDCSGWKSCSGTANQRGEDNAPFTVTAAVQ